MRESPFLQQVAEEAKVEQARKYVLRVLQLRFGEQAATEFEDAINRTQHLEQFDALLQLALQTRGVSQFRQALPRT